MLLQQLRAKVTVPIVQQESTQEEIDSLTANLAELRQRIENTSWQVQTRSIEITDACIVIEERQESEIDLSKLSSVQKRINLPGGSYLSLAGNDRYLLIHAEPYLHLVDREMKIIRTTNWPHEAIWDMCWLPMVERFAVVGDNSVVFVDEHSLTIERVETSESRQWLSCICSETSLFLATKEYGTSILEFQVIPAVELIREWMFPLTCAEDEVIHDHEYKNDAFALIIMNSSSQASRFELKSAKNWTSLWSLPLDLHWRYEKAFRCCSIGRNAWMIGDYVQGRLLHITDDGQVKTTVNYDDGPRRVALLGTDVLAILTTVKVNFHQLRND